MSIQIIFRNIIMIPLMSILLYANNCPKWLPLPSDSLVVVVPIYNPSITGADFDCDGLIDALDPDIDNDGILNADDPNDYNPAIPSKATLALNKIKAYASSNGASAIPSVQDYIDVGVTGITSSNLVTMNQLVANLTQNDVDTQSELQVLANTVSQNKYWKDTLEISKNVNSEDILSLHSSIDANGNAFVVWAETLKSDIDSVFYSNTKVSRYNAQTNLWTDLGYLEEGSRIYTSTYNEKVSNLQSNIAMNNSGDAIAVWVQYGDYLNAPRHYDLSLRVKHFDASTNQWGDITILTHQSVAQINDRGSIMKPKVVLSDDGSALVVWRGRTGTSPNHYDVYSLHYSVAQGWDATPQKHSQVADNNAFNEPDIAIRPNGDAIIVWNENNTSTGNTKLFSTLYHANINQWSTPEEINSQNSHRSSEPKVLFDSLGNMVVLWADRASPKAIWTRRYNTNTSTWETPHRLATSNSQLLRPKMAIDASDNIIVTWVEAGATNLLISSRYLATTDTWSSPTTASNTYSGNAYELSMDTQGTAMLIGRSSKLNEFGFTPYVTQFKPNAGWENNATAIESENNQGDSFDEQLLSDENGNFIAIWKDKKTIRENGTTKSIYSIRATHYK